MLLLCVDLCGVKGVAVGTRAGSIQWSAWDDLVEISKQAKSVPSSIVTKGHFGMVFYI